MSDTPIDDLNPMPKRDRMDRDERIRHRAYQLWESSGMPEGKDTEHWLAAETEARAAEGLVRPVDLASEKIGSVDLGNTPSPDLSGANADPHWGSVSDGPTAPKMAGGSKPASDTSRSPIANRDVAGTRKAGTTPRPATNR